MTQLYNAIQQHAAAEAAASDWSAVAAILNGPGAPVRITELRNSRWLMSVLDSDVGNGATEADIVLGTMQASTVPRIKEALALMAGEGIDLSDPQVQKMIPAMAAEGNWPDSIVEKLTPLTFRTQTIAQTAGFPSVTAKQCEDHYTAGKDAEDGNLVFNDRRILLCLNDGPHNDSLTIRLTPVATVGELEVKGKSTTHGGVDANLTGRDKVLYADLLAAVEKWENS